MSSTARPSRPTGAARAERDPAEGLLAGPDPDAWGDGLRPEELMRRVADGDLEAFGMLHRHMAGRVHHVAMRVLWDRSLSQEVSQETFLRLWLTASRFDPRQGSAAAWVAMIAHRAAVDRVRSTQAAKERDSRYHQRDRAIPADVTADAALARITAVEVRDALSTLTAAHREALLLAYYGGLSHSEIAARLDVPLGTAKTRVRKAMVHLRRHLVPPSGNDDDPRQDAGGPTASMA